jgi:uncharacterized protein
MTRPLPAAMLTLCLLAPPLALAAQDTADYAASIETWREHRVAALTRDTGWLTLAALYTLEPGSHSLGSGPDVELGLPPSTPPLVGELEVTDDATTVHVAPGVAATAAGEPVTTLAMTSDAAGDPTVVTLGTVSFFVIERGGTRLLRVRDSESPERRHFAGIDSFPIDPSWHFDARFEPHEPLLQIPVANILGMVEDTPSWGAVVFEHDGETYRLDALAAPGDEELFLIFADATTGKETYGAGRYLYVDAPDVDGHVDLDFNRAYNPPCAFTSFATCPLPPRQNRLPLRIEAGEKVYAGPH